MPRQLTLTLILALTCWCSAAEPKRVPQEVLDRIVDDDPNPRPRYLTPSEQLQSLQDAPLAPPVPMAPPTGTVDTPAEYEPNDGLLFRWGTWNSLLTEMTVAITTSDETTIVWMLVANSSQENSCRNTLIAAGADIDQVEFITYLADTVWIRDYGPRFIEEDDERAVIDHYYGSSRPLDNAFPDHLCSLWGLPQYDLPLWHGGGNFHVFATGEAFMSSLIVDGNPSYTPQEVRDLIIDYHNVDLTIYTGFPTSFDGTRHIDMWMLPVDDDEIIIGEYASSTGQPYTITESAVTDLESRGYTVHRTPGWNSGGTHYTYTNAVIMNEIVMVPWYSGYNSQNADALATFEAAFEDRTIVQIDCSQIIHYAGAIHCIMMHVPTTFVDPVPQVTVLAPNGGEALSVGQTFDLTWEATDDVAVTAIDLYYSTDGGATYPNVIATGEANDGLLTWTVPDAITDTARVKVVAHDADLNAGEDSSDGNCSIAATPMQAHGFYLDTDPGWSCEGDWEWGQPLGGGTHGGDPSAGHTDLYVYGYNLSGDYPSWLPPQYLTTPAIDCSDLTDVELRFWRWLGVESYTGYDVDHATVEVSNNGSDFVTVWENTGDSIADDAWVAMTVDISAVADGQPTVYVRWGMGPTDSSITYFGWNIDDIEIWGNVTYDLNHDGQIDLSDHARFLDCLVGPDQTPAAPGCDGAMLDGDGDVDLEDYALFSALLAN